MRSCLLWASATVIISVNDHWFCSLDSYYCHVDTENTTTNMWGVFCCLKWVLKLKMTGDHFVKNWPVNWHSDWKLQRLPFKQGGTEPWVYRQMSPTPNAIISTLRLPKFLLFPHFRKGRLQKKFKPDKICLLKIHSSPSWAQSTVIGKEGRGVKGREGKNRKYIWEKFFF